MSTLVTVRVDSLISVIAKISGLRLAEYKNSLNRDKFFGRLLTYDYKRVYLKRSTGLDLKSNF